MINHAIKGNVPMYSAVGVGAEVDEDDGNGDMSM
jgi:hypothetical protein